MTSKKFTLFIILIILLISLSCNNTTEKKPDISLSPTPSPPAEEKTSTPEKTEEDAPYLKEGLDYYRKGKYDEALAYFNNTLAIYPEDKNLWLYKGITLFAINNYTEAIVCYDKVLAIDENNAKAWHYKGLALMQLNNTEEGIKCFKKAISINPNYMEEKNRLSLKEDLKPAPTKAPPEIKPVTPTTIPNWDIITEVKEQHD